MLWRRMKAAAPSIEPPSVPVPPMMTMRRASPEVVHRKASGQDGPEERGEERPGDAPHRPADHEGQELVAVDRVADRLHAPLVVVDAAEHVAKGRADAAPQEN